MNRHFLIPILALWACACASSESESESTIIVPTEQTHPLEEFVSQSQHIVLETRDDNIISNIDDIKINNDTIIIYEQQKGKLSLYNMQGGYISSIDKQGRGHGEYLSLDDFQLFDSKVYALSRASKRINVYTPQGDFIEKIDLDDWYEKFTIVDQNQMFLYSEQSNDQLFDFILFDYKKSEVVSKFAPFPKNESFSSIHRPFNLAQSGELLVTKPFDYSIYELSREGIQARYSLSFDTQEQFPADKESMALFDLSQALNYKPVVKTIDHLYANDEVITIIYSLFIEGLGNRQLISRINTKTSEVATHILDNEFNSKMPYLSPIAISGDCLISALPAFALLDIETHYSLSTFKDLGLTPEDNPVIFLHKIRE